MYPLDVTIAIYGRHAEAITHLYKATHLEVDFLFLLFGMVIYGHSYF